jgi:hypothetical protein
VYLLFFPVEDLRLGVYPPLQIGEYLPLFIVEEDPSFGYGDVSALLGESAFYVGYGIFFFPGEFFTFRGRGGGILFPGCPGMAGSRR